MYHIRKILSKFRVLYHNLVGGGNHLPLSIFLDFGTRLHIAKGAKLIVGQNVVLRSDQHGYHCGMPFACTLLADTKEAVIEIGCNTRINGAYIHAQRKIHIGKNCLIAAGVNIIDSNGHKVCSDNRTKGRDIPSPIHIGDNVWIGLNSIVLKGTIIGRNSVIGAGSVVKGTFPDNSLIMGNPARVVRTLNIPDSKENNA